MKNWLWIAVVLAVVAALGAQEVERPKGVFNSLKVGQAVMLKDNGQNFSISFLDEEVPLAHEVVEIGTDHIVLRDQAGVREIVIPVYSVKSIEKVRTKGE